MHLPAHLKIGKARYTLHVRPTLTPRRLMGRVYFGIRSIEIATHDHDTGEAYPSHEIAETFWHEVTHAILHEMAHPLSRNEPFVTQFSHLLTRAIYSARF